MNQYGMQTYKAQQLVPVSVRFFIKKWLEVALPTIPLLQNQRIETRY